MDKLTLPALIQSLNEDPNINGMIQSSPICHKFFDPELKLQFMSQCGANALKIKNIEEFYGKSFPPPFAPKETHAIITNHMQRAAKGETSIAEYHFVVEEKAIWFRTTFSPCLDAEGNLLYVRADSMDITSMKVAEKGILSAKEEAEKANAAKSDFLSRMSHELRTPLNAILGFGQLMGQDPEDPLTQSQENRLSEIIKGGKHLLELIDEVLDLSRIESNKITISIENVNLHDVFLQTLNLALPMAQQNNISVENKLQKDLFVQADPTKLKQVLLNLLTNAIKYNSENGSVVLDAYEIAQSRVCISVKDTGIGIPTKQYKSIFEPFNRLDRDQTEIEGTGIGLTISKKLMEKMDGSVKVTSEVGQGSIFILELLKGYELKVSSPSKENCLALPKFKPNRDEYKLLYIEDNTANLTLVRQILKRRKDITLLTAPQAQVGIDLARAHVPDLILMDINLPEIDGIEAFRRLSILESTKHIPVIAVSANAMELDIKKALKIGFKAYIKKPFDLKKFMQTIDVYLIKKELEEEDEIETLLKIYETSE